MKISIVLEFDINQPTLKYLVAVFIKSLRYIFETIVTKTLYAYAEKYKNNGKLNSIFNSSHIIWKSKKGNRKTKILTIFGYIVLPQIQIQCKDLKRKIYITRTLLGLEERKIIPEITKKVLALIGALTPYRCAQKILNLLSNTRVSLMTIQRAVKHIAGKINFSINEKETTIFEADGTGVPVLNAGKRGKELKILVQRRKSGKILVNNVTLGKYCKGWHKLFEPFKKVFEKLKIITLITDGDTNIFKSVKANVKIIFQRCLWHIPHNTKYTLWQDGVKRKSDVWLYILGRILAITNIKKIKENDEKLIEEVIRKKTNELENLIVFCKTNKYCKTSKFLNNAKDNIFSGISNGLKGGTSSRIERVMRTLNHRINVGKWSDSGVLAISKIRCAYYYNHWDVEY